MPKALHIEGSRWLLLDDDVARAHAVAKALESAGAEVLLSGTHPVEAQISSFRQFGAAGALIEETNLEAIGTLLQRIQTDPWLHPIGLIPICWQQLYDPDSQRVELEALKLRVLPHWQLEHDQLEALLHGQTVGVAQLGIAKLLRASLRRDWHGELKLDSGGVQYRLVVARARLWSLRIDEQERIGSVAAALPCLLAIEQGTMSWEERTSELATGALGVSLDVLIGNLPANIVSVSAPPQPKAPPVPDEIRPVEFASQLERQQRATIDTGTRPAERWSVVAAALGRVYLSAQNRWSAWGHRQRYAVSIGLAAAITLPLLAMGRQGRQVLATVAAASASAVPLALDVPREPRTVTGGLELVHAPDQAESLADRSSKAPSQGCERWNQASSAKLGERMAAGWAKVQAKTEWHAARRAIQIGDWDKAERLLCLSAILDPTGPGPVDLVGLFLSRGLPEPADHWGTWAVAHQPRNSKAIQMLADVRIQQGRTDEAKGLLHQSMNVSADDKQVLKQVARKYTQVAYQAFRARDPYQARRLFLRAHALDSDYALATAGLSEVELQTGDPDRALQWAQTAATLDPNCFEAQLNLGDARAKHGEAAAAKQAWLEALRLQPASIAIRRRLGL